MKNAKALMLASLLSVSGLVLVGCGSSCGSKGCKVETVKTKEVVVTKEVAVEGQEVTPVQESSDEVDAQDADVKG